MFVKDAHFLEETSELFDHNFFGTTPVETMTVIPTQPKFLNVTHNASENAGEPWGKFSGSNTGVSRGNFKDDHQLIQIRDADHTLPCVITDLCISGMDISGGYPQSKRSSMKIL